MVKRYLLQEQFLVGWFQSLGAFENPCQPLGHLVTC